MCMAGAPCAQCIGCGAFPAPPQALQCGGQPADSPALVAPHPRRSPECRRRLLTGDAFAQQKPHWRANKISEMSCVQLRLHLPFFVKGHKDSAGLGRILDIPMPKHVLPCSSVNFWRFKETCRSWHCYGNLCTSACQVCHAPAVLCDAVLTAGIPILTWLFCQIWLFLAQGA